MFVFKKLKVVSILLASFVSYTALAEDASVQFTGLITANTCTLDTSAMSSTVVMPDVKVTDFGATGSEAAFRWTEGFKLKGCPVRSMKLKLEGIPDPILSDYIKLSNTGQTGAASGVAVKVVFDTEAKHTQVRASTPLTPSFTPAADGSFPFRIYSAYIRTGSSAPTPGVVQAAVNYTIVYD